MNLYTVPRSTSKYSPRNRHTARITINFTQGKYLGRWDHNFPRATKIFTIHAAITRKHAVGVAAFGTYSRYYPTRSATHHFQYSWWCGTPWCGVTVWYRVYLNVAVEAMAVLHLLSGTTALDATRSRREEDSLATSRQLSHARRWVPVVYIYICVYYPGPRVPQSCNHRGVVSSIGPLSSGRCRRVSLKWAKTVIGTL